MKLAESLFNLGRAVEARELFRDCCAADPSNLQAFDDLGMCETILGNHERALAALSRHPELENERLMQPDLLIARWNNGAVARSEIEARAQVENLLIPLETYLYALLDHPDPTQRDPKFVLTLLTERARAIPEVRWKHTLEMVARVRLGDWPGALAVYEGAFQPPYLLVATPACYHFIAALIYAKNGRAAEASQAYKLGMTVWEDQTRDAPSEWERSDAMRWRREAEAAMVK
jgi:tetratricopeptide (TPR) repeat protein